MSIPSKERRRAERQAQRKVEKAAVEAKEEKLRPRIITSLPSRPHEPESVITHLGPTNSGKTHEALQFLASSQGVYAAPLRMLAQEAYERLVTLAGDQRVGLVTGEERINESAPIIACTTEMAPKSGETLVLDEVHWAADRERGSAWTKLLVSGSYRHIRLLGSLDVKPLLEKAFPDLEVIIHERLGPLEWAGKVSWKKLPSDTVVIGFSRKTVLWIAHQLANRYGADRVAVLYGSMPVFSRRKEIRRVLEGEADLIVSTDVLGHGVNLPCQQVLFAETQKFDGQVRRNLRPWEAAQIAGRAGRYGQHQVGYTGTISGLKWFEPQAEVIKEALTPQEILSDGTKVYQAIKEARYRPSLEDLGAEGASDLPVAISLWVKEAKAYFKAHDWIAIEKVGPLQERLKVINSSLGKELGALDKLSLEEAWSLSKSPLDPTNPNDRELLIRLTRSLAHHRDLNSLLSSKFSALSLESLEKETRKLSALRWFTQVFPKIGNLDAQKVAYLEREASEALIKALSAEVNSTSIGKCKSCGGGCAPWYQHCDLCFSGGFDDDWY